MNFIKTEIEGLTIIEPKIFEDQRGYFFESYNQQDFAKNGIVGTSIKKYLSNIISNEQYGDNVIKIVRV